MQFHPERRKQLAEIERRSWQLWAISLTIMCCLAFGIALLVYPVLGGYVQHLEFERGDLPQLVAGLVTLVVLSGTYIVLKQRELNALRSFIIASYAASALPKENYPHDSLTGLLDRSALPDVLKNESERADRAASPFSVVIFDIQDFGNINAREGNLVGDLILKEFALLLLRTIRQNDSVLRYGPDEFLCVLAGAPLEGGEAFVRRVEKGGERVSRLRGLTLEAGLAVYGAGADAEGTVARAEQELRNRVGSPSATSTALPLA